MEIIGVSGSDTIRRKGSNGLKRPERSRKQSIFVLTKVLRLSLNFPRISKPVYLRSGAVYPASVKRSLMPSFLFQISAMRRK
jgi:hypothetical protein